MAEDHESPIGAQNESLAATERMLLARMREVYGGKPWIVAGEMGVAIAGGVTLVQSLGASDAIGIVSRRGVGEIPDNVRLIVSDGSLVGDDASMIERMHDNDRELHDLPQWVIDEVDEWDPDQQAQAIVAFTVDGGLIANRPTFGARRPEWAELEDKIRIRQIWEHAGIDTAPDRVVALDDIDELVAAHDALAGRWGTVWAQDNEQGWHGGAQGTHWVSDHDGVRALAQRLQPHHRAVRIQPFLEGVPCSIHGMVFRDEVVAMRPCEMLVLIDPRRHTLHYSRAATFWDPDETDRESMRSTVRAVGRALRTQVDFRGAFTLDGVLTADGFRPTEVNPRFGAALPPRLPTTDGGEISLFFTHLLVASDNLDHIDPMAIEHLLVTHLDENRFGTAFIRTGRAPEEEQQVEIRGRWKGGAFVNLQTADDGSDSVIASATWGAEPGGGLIFVRFTDAMPKGYVVAPTLVEVRRFLSAHWNLELAELRHPFDQ